MTARILLVEDEPAILESLAYVLGRDGFMVVLAKTAAEANALAQGVDLVVLDLMLPDGSGFDLIRGWRATGHPMPIIVLSSRDAEADRVAALESGADDYVTKPFSPREIVARVRAVLRRSTAAPASTRPAGKQLSPITTDARTRRAVAAGRSLDLTRVEFDLLATLLGSPGRVFTRAELIDRVWGDGFRITDRTIDSHVKALRRKIAEAGAEPSWIETVRGVGYRLSDEPEAAEPA
ncbi:MAG TPA: response regulator transcription factor [Polyangiaceae bacterium]|nr:response regulator transcription factor [Polyangiaceae bacterium]